MTLWERTGICGKEPAIQRPTKHSQAQIVQVFHHAEACSTLGCQTIKLDNSRCHLNSQIDSPTAPPQVNKHRRHREKVHNVSSSYFQSMLLHTPPRESILAFVCVIQSSLAKPAGPLFFSLFILSVCLDKFRSAGLTHHHVLS